MGFILGKTGTNVPTTDILIAAAAITADAALLHKDKHFTLIAKEFSLEQIGID